MNSLQMKEVVHSTDYLDSLNVISKQYPSAKFQLTQITNPFKNTKYFTFWLLTQEGYYRLHNFLTFCTKQTKTSLLQDIP
jgi:hypothetical protein